MIYKVRNYLTSNCLKTVYLSLAYPHFLYGSVIWGGTFHTYLNNLFVTQKKMLRVMACRDRYAHTDPLFKHFGLLKLFDIIALQTNIFVYKSLYVTEIECNFRIIQNPQTRRQNRLQLPLHRTSHSQRYLSYRGAHQWNQLSDDIRNSNSVNVFKKKIKHMYLNRY